MEADLSFRGKILENSEGADAVAWAAMEEGEKLKKVYLKLPKLGKEDIRINVEYCGICQSDVTSIKGKTMLKTYPMVAGHEIIGRVGEIGSEVAEFKKGDLVGVGPVRGCCMMCEYCKAGKENLCETIYNHFTVSPNFGGFSTTVQVPTTYAFKIPEGIPAELAPPLMCAGSTVYAPIRKYGQIGGKIAVIGMGGLGHLAIQFARKMGMKTYAVSTSLSKKDTMMKLGADEFVLSTDPVQFTKFLGAKIDLILNTTDSPDVDQYMRALKKGSGVLVQLGLPNMGVKINAGEILFNEWTYTGTMCCNRDDMKSMLEFAELNKIKCLNEYFSFEDMQKAFDRTASGNATYRVVVDYTKFD